MPRGDKTGPLGQGPMTGRRLGYCIGNATPGYANQAGGGMGMAWRRGGGRGMGQRYSAVASIPPVDVAPVEAAGQYTADPSGEIERMEAQNSQIMSSIETLVKRIDSLEKSLNDKK